MLSSVLSVCVCECVCVQKAQSDEQKYALQQNLERQNCLTQKNHMIPTPLGAFVTFFTLSSLVKIKTTSNLKMT